MIILKVWTDSYKTQNYKPLRSALIFGLLIDVIATTLKQRFAAFQNTPWSYTDILHVRYNVNILNSKKLNEASIWTENNNFYPP